MDEVIIPVEGEEVSADVESFRTAVESRLHRLEANVLQFAPPDAVQIPAVLADGSTVAGLIRTFETRILQMETNVAENTSANLRLADALANLQAAVKALQPPGE